MKIKTKVLNKAIKEINKVVDCEPPIDAEADAKERDVSIYEAIDIMNDDDEFTEETQGVIDTYIDAREDDDDDDDAEETPKEKKARIKKEKAAAKAKEDDDDDNEEEEETSKEKKVRIKKKKAAAKAKEEEDDDDDDDDAEETPKEKKARLKKEKAAKKAAKGYSRIDAVCEALLNDEPETIKEWAKIADKEYADKTGRDSNPKETMYQINKVSATLKHFKVDFPKK